MTWPIHVRAPAEKDITRIRDWYEKREHGLGGEFRIVVKQAMAHLRTSPDLLPPYYGSFYRLQTERFPFKIFYRIEGHKVVVFRVLHASQDHTRELPNF